MRPPLLSSSAVQEALKGLEGWTLEKKSLQRTFRFPDFQASFAFMTAVAVVAEELNHHPDWRQCYNVVEVELSTHDQGGLTELDFALARAMDRIFRPG